MIARALSIYLSLSRIHTQRRLKRTNMISWFRLCFFSCIYFNWEYVCAEHTLRKRSEKGQENATNARIRHLMISSKQHPRHCYLVLTGPSYQSRTEWIRCCLVHIYNIYVAWLRTRRIARGNFVSVLCVNDRWALFVMWIVEMFAIQFGISPTNTNKGSQ